MAGSALRRKRVRLGAIESSATVLWYVLGGGAFAAAGVFMLVQGAPWLFAGLFVAIGVLTLGVAGHTVLGAAKFGRVTLELDVPVPLGSELVAMLHVPRGRPGGHLSATLRCVRVVWRRGGESSHLVEEPDEIGSGRFALQRGRRGGMQCEIRLQMPIDAPVSRGGSTASINREGVFWDVQVESDDLPGADLMRGFRFPVVAPADADARWEAARRAAGS